MPFKTFRKGYNFDRLTAPFAELYWRHCRQSIQLHLKLRRLFHCAAFAAKQVYDLLLLGWHGRSTGRSLSVLVSDVFVMSGSPMWRSTAPLLPLTAPLVTLSERAATFVPRFWKTVMLGLHA